MKSLSRIISETFFDHPCLVLMYHRIAEPVSDVWEIAVSRENFIGQLKVLKNYHVISIKEMIEQFAKKRIKRNSIAISFDDGFADNFLVAKPLLESYKLPATFFVSSCNTGRHSEFWWDELENLVLFTQTLPQHFECLIEQKQFRFDLGTESVLTSDLRSTHQSWKATLDKPPTIRCEFFYKLWEVLKPLPEPDQQAVLEHIWNWAGLEKKIRSRYISMSVEQLKALSENTFFDVAAHTITHPALASHPYPYQQKELANNKHFLEDIVQEKISILSYPYGNYNSTTIDAARDAGFDTAFTTEERPVTRHSNRLKLGRYQVKDWDKGFFEQQIKKWLTHK